jgi:hypothetical protein
MAQYNFRLNVTAAQFPFLSYQGGATVITANQDTYYIRPNAFSGEASDKNIGVPQLMFCENVMPVSYGVQSVNYINSTNPFPGGAEEGDQLFYVISQVGLRYLANYNRKTRNLFIYDTELSIWRLVHTSPAHQSPYATVAIVQGRTFIFLRGNTTLLEFIEYNTVTHTFQIVLITPLGISDLSPITGIVGANNYLIMYTPEALYYTIPDSIPGSIPDFTPSLGATGAATETPSVLRGLIEVCFPVSDGFLMFTSTSIVAAYYSSNIRFPWSYRELENSAPITSLDAIGTDRENYVKYVNTTGGILKLAKSAAAPALPEATEFFSSGRYEYYDWPSHSIKTRDTTDPINIGVAYVGGRWLILSYGEKTENVFTHAVIWDEHLKRWGKVAIHHVRAIEYFGVPAKTTSVISSVTYQNLLDLTWTYTQISDETRHKTYADLGGTGFVGDPDLGLQYKSLGFVTTTGIVQVMDFTVKPQEDPISVAMFGKVQLTRNHRFKITDVWSENFNEGPPTNYTKLSIIATKDMRNTRKIVAGWVRSAENQMVHHQFHGCEGANHTLRYEGDFNISSIIVRGTPTGVM